MSKRSIAYVEIPAADRHAAAEFYLSLCEWDYEHSMEPVPYTTAQTANMQAGLTEPRDDFPVGSPLLYISSTDIDADLKRVEELGGQIVAPKTEIPDTGWFGIFTDPTGNTIGLFHMVE